jgi:hypothetical protein
VSTPIGTYNPPHTRHERPHRIGPTLVQCLMDAGGGMANAHYAYDGPDGDGIHYRYTLQRIEEWMPPMSPRERREMLTDQARLPPLDEHGGIDVIALAARRRAEWAEEPAA